MMLRALPLIGVVCLGAADPDGNPFFQRWKTPFAVPPFAQIKPEHILPAMKEGLQKRRQQVQAISRNPASPTFANTVEALAYSGELLDKVGAVLNNLSSAETNEAIQSIQREVAPLLAGAEDDIRLDGKLFNRVKKVYKSRDRLKLSPEQRTLLEKTYREFVRGGAELSETQKSRFREINQDMARISVAFGDNVLKETNDYRLVIDKVGDLSGLPESSIHAAAEAAKSAGLEGKWVFTLQSTSIWPFLAYAEKRSLRKELLTAYLQRCDHDNASDNKALISRMIALRLERAKLLGYRSHADFVLEEAMARTPATALKLMSDLWKPALNRAKAERAELQKVADQQSIKLEAWDWRYYAEKVRKAKYDLDETSLREYFPLEAVRAGAFLLAQRLYGLTFTERSDLPTYHPEVRTFEVKEADGRHVGVLYMDDHPRPGKRGGAWCSVFRGQCIREGAFVTPVVVNVGNYARPVAGKPALLNLDEVTTLFHEFGHGLHQLLSHVRYPTLSGTSVPRDFVELPSQIMENWCTEPEMLRLYARHYLTEAPMPDAMIEKLQAASLFNQGFEKTEFLAAVLLDLDWHTLTDASKAKDVRAFEKASLDTWGLIPEIPVRYRTPYFLHLFVWNYSASYYSYMWSEVLDADAFSAFTEQKNLFHPATAKAFREHILSKGGSEDPAQLYRRFRGRDPKVDALLDKRGLR